MPRQEPAPETPGIVIGNTTPKYTSRNPAIRWLTERWVDNLEHILERISQDTGSNHKRALEVGCGEGVIADKLQRRWSEVVAFDLPDAGLRNEWRRLSGPRFLHANAHALPFDDDQFDLVVAVEVLEHLHDPVTGLREMARVGRRNLVLSVPREPIFRSCNLLAGRYVRDLGNTPGHVGHWSKRSFVRFVSTIADVHEVSVPFPWTTVWATIRS